MNSNLEQVNVTGEKLVASGLCLARSNDGEIVFVDGLLPEEKASVEIVAQKAKTKFAAVIEIEVESDIRVEPPCEFVSKGCGGCDWQHVEPNSQSDFKKEIVIDSLTRIGKIENAANYVNGIVVCEKENYRTSARVLANKNSWGFRAKNSEDMVEVSTCMVLHPECETQANDALSNINDDYEYEVTLRRHPDTFMGQMLSVSQDSFFQSHIDAPQVLAKIILEEFKDEEDLSCVDLYSGVGIFALALALKGHKVLSIEGNISSHKDALKNLKGLNAKAVHFDVKKFDFSNQKFLQYCDVVIADPSREGLKQAGVKAVLSTKAEKVILISCDPAAGARDIRTLIDSGYKLNAVTPIDMFGYTHHVEMVSVLTR